MGKVLHVNLTDETIRTDFYDEKTMRQYIGGSGLGARILYDETDEYTDPLGPENVLIFMTGPLTGTRIPMSGRHAVVAKSPLTGIWGEADSGGHWGYMLKRAGYDGIVFRGAARKPVYLWLHEDGVEIRSAEAIWGQDSFVTEELIQKETDPKAVVACIGPAGEKMVKMAAIMNDGKDARAAGRCGLGAVMGSKNLKAVAVYGNAQTPVAEPEKLADMAKTVAKQIVEKTRAFHEYGTSGGLQTAEKVGDLPIQNWRTGAWEDGAAKISGQAMADSILTGKYFCQGCVIGCGRVVKQYFAPFIGVNGGGPEYETLGMIGSNTLIDDLEAIAKANELCNRYGMDTISVGGVVAFAIECFEHDLITVEDTGGLELAWGDSECVLSLIQKIGEKEDIGELLSEGTRRAAEEIGGIAAEFAIHVKGLEFPAHDPRAYNSLGVGYATANRGACHLQGFSYAFERGLKSPDMGFPEVMDRFAVERKGELAAKTQDLMSMFDSLKLCKFILNGGIDVHDLVEWLNASTGWDVTLEEFMRTGERLYNLKRMYNVRCGISRKDDTIPMRILTQPRREGGAGYNLPPFGPMLHEYYQVRGWSDEGIPRVEKLEELDLTE
jgi:aldehyde:ferredoxin oxidoreductase